MGMDWHTTRELHKVRREIKELREVIDIVMSELQDTIVAFENLKTDLASKFTEIKDEINLLAQEHNIPAEKLEALRGMVKDLDDAVTGFKATPEEAKKEEPETKTEPPAEPTEEKPAPTEGE